MPKAKDFDDLLRRAGGAPAADPEFKDELRQRLVGLHPASANTREARKAVERSIAAESGRIRMRSFTKVGLGVVAVAAAAALVFVLAPGLFGRGPVAEFGVLPPVATGIVDNVGAEGGPGYTFTFDYSLGGSLAGGLPALAEKQTVYKLMPFEFTEAHVGALAKNLGLGGAISRDPFHDGWTLSTGDGQGRTIMAFDDGYVIYNDNYDWAPATRAELPSDERAIAVAREWLTKTSGFVPDAASGPSALSQGTVAAELDQGSVLVTFRPAEPADVITVNPGAAVRIGRDEKIIMGQATWYPADKTSAYPLRTAAQAWEMVKAGKGALKIDFNKYGPFGDVMEVTGPAACDSVRLGWALVMGTDKTPYQVPVYIFSAKADVPTQTGGQLPFEVYVPAVAEQYVGQ